VKRERVVFEVCNSVTLLQFLCVNSVARRRLVETENPSAWCNGELGSV
jgi:hypothetical protein